MPQKFLLEIDLGNEGMQTPDDIGRSLRICAGYMENAGLMRGNLRDINGNVVGKYGVTG